MRNEIMSIHAGWLIDGSGTAVQSQMRLGLENGTIQTAREIGVRIALGTDAGSAGVVHGKAVIEEMRIFLEGRVSN